jgi:hypothetical protein
MRNRYPVRVATGLSSLQTVFVFALLAIVAPPVLLRVIAAVAGVYYLGIVPIQLLAQRIWRRLTTGKKVEYKATTSDGEPATQVSAAEAKAAYGDVIDRATAWGLSLQLSLIFFVISAWPTKYCVALASVFLIYQGSRFVRGALIYDRVGRPAPSPEPSPPPDIEKALKTLHLGFLLRFNFVQARIARAARASTEETERPAATSLP